MRTVNIPPLLCSTVAPRGLLFLSTSSNDNYSWLHGFPSQDQGGPGCHRIVARRCWSVWPIRSGATAMDSASSVERARAECRRQLPELLPRLGRFAIGLTRARYDADDLVQAACERALSRSDQWDPETALDSWMFRIVQTIWLNELRARKVRERHADREQADRIATRRESSDARLLLLRTEEEIFRLPDDLRIVLLLVGVE